MPSHGWIKFRHQNGDRYCPIFCVFHIFRVRHSKIQPINERRSQAFLVGIYRPNDRAVPSEHCTLFDLEPYVKLRLEVEKQIV